MTKDKPIEALRPYVFHGLELEITGKEAIGDCPLCGRGFKFSVNIDTGQWRCFVCGEQGNSRTFLTKIWGMYNRGTNPNIPILSLRKERSLLFASTLLSWCVVWDGSHYWVPSHGVDRKLYQLYRYSRTAEGMRLLPTPTLGHGIFGSHLLKPKHKTVYLCEGPWDAMVLWEVLEQSKLDDCGVLATPGCTTFFPTWAPLFEDRQVVILYDSDHPVEKNGKTSPPAGFTGAKRAAQILASGKNPPKSIRLFNWGEEIGYNPEFPSGTDLRDILGGQTGV